MVFIDKWPLFGGYIVLRKGDSLNQGMVTEVWPLFTGWSLFRGGLNHRFDCTYIDKRVLWRKLELPFLLKREGNFNLLVI